MRLKTWCLLLFLIGFFQSGFAEVYNVWIESEPSAKIYLNGRDTGLSTSRYIQLSAGTHEIKLVRGDYFYVANLKVGDGYANELIVRKNQWEQVPKRYFNINLDSEPSGALIYKNGKYLGKTPYSGEHREGDRDKYVLYKNDYFPYYFNADLGTDVDETIMLKKGKKVKVTCNIKDSTMAILDEEKSLLDGQVKYKNVSLPYNIYMNSTGDPKEIIIYSGVNDLNIKQSIKYDYPYDEYNVNVSVSKNELNINLFDKKIKNKIFIANYPIMKLPFNPYEDIPEFNTPWIITSAILLGWPSTWFWGYDNIQKLPISDSGLHGSFLTSAIGAIFNIVTVSYMFGEYSYKSEGEQLGNNISIICFFIERLFLIGPIVDTFVYNAKIDKLRKNIANEINKTKSGLTSYVTPIVNFNFYVLPDTKIDNFGKSFQSGLSYKAYLSIQF